MAITVSHAELDAARIAADEVRVSLLGVWQFLREVANEVQPRGLGDDPALAVELVMRGVRHLEEHEATHVWTVLRRLADEAKRGGGRPMPTRRQLALIHVVKAKLGLSEDEYRAAPVHVAGVESARDLDRAGFDAVMGLLERMGFQPATPRSPTYGQRPGFASPAQVQLVRALWAEWTEGRGDERGLSTWLERSFGVKALRFLTAERARHAITALKTMKARTKRAA